MSSYQEKNCSHLQNEIHSMLELLELIRQVKQGHYYANANSDKNIHLHRYLGQLFYGTWMFKCHTLDYFIFCVSQLTF